MPLELRVGNYRLDGWVEEKRLGIEFNGCAFHGCPKCFDANDIMPGGKTAAKLRERDAKRLEEIRKMGIQVHVYWECQVDEWLERDPEMKKCFDNYMDEGPIDLNKCFFGGRTGPLNLYYKPKQGEQISYYDVTSLYPFVK